MKKRILIAAMIIVLIATTAVLFACRKKSEDPTIKTIYDVSNGTAAVGAAIEKAVMMDNAANIYMSFKFSDRTGDTAGMIYDFAAMLDLDNDYNSTLSFKGYTYLDNSVTAEVYYDKGTLYVNHQPAIDQAKMTNVSLAKVASALVDSKNTGTINTIVKTLPALGNRVFSSCERVQEGDAYAYTFTVDYTGIGECVGYLVSKTDLMSAADMTRLLRLDKVDNTNATKIVFHTRTVDGAEVFEGAECITSPASGEGAVSTKAVENFTCKVLSNEATSNAQYRIYLPDNLSSFGYTHPANLDLKGTLTFDIGSSSGDVNLGAQPLTTSFYASSYAWDVTLKSNVDAGGNWTALLTLVSRQDATRAANIYYCEGVLYVDLSAMSMGRWKMSATALQEIADTLGRARATQVLTETDYRDIVFDLLIDRQEKDDKVTYTLNADSVLKIYNALQETLSQNALCTLPPIEVNGVTLELNLQSNAFRALNMTAQVWGSRAIFATNSNPKVGRAVDVAEPDWVNDCKNPREVQTITPVARGVMRSSTLLGYSHNTELVEAFLHSISGTNVSLEGEIAYYNFAANISPEGTIDAISIDFDTDQNERVCSIYYYRDPARQAADGEMLYVILPSQSGAVRVQALTLAQGLRYGEFFNTICGEVQANTHAECLLSVSQSDVSFTFSATGFNNMCARLAKIMSAMTIKSLPVDLNLQAVRLTVGDGRALRLIFGEQYIEFNVTSFALTDAPLAISEPSLALPDYLQNVSYFDEYHMPDSVDVVIGDGSAQPRSLRLSLAECNTQWTFDIPPLDGITHNVTAYCTVLGQRVMLEFNVDCTRPDKAELNYNVNLALRGGKKMTDYYDAASHMFTFGRYHEDNRISDIMGADTNTNVKMVEYSVTLTFGGEEVSLPSAVQWTYLGKPFSDADWSDMSQATTNNAEGNLDYKIQPAVYNFFGQLQPLAEFMKEDDAAALPQFILRLHGEKIVGIVNQDSYMTLSTYATGSGEEYYDPFDSMTYDNGGLVFATGSATPKPVDKSEVDRWEWDIDSIKNDAGKPVKRNGTSLTEEGFLNALREDLYNLDGKYIIDLYVYNTLGVAESSDGTDGSIKVGIFVKPYKIKSVTFTELADGVSFDAAKSTFSVESRVYRAVNANFVFANKVQVTFENGATKQFDAKSWTVTPISAVVMFKAYEGDVTLTVGDSVGGWQDINLRYKVLGTEATKVALWGEENGNKVTLGEELEVNGKTESLAYTLTGLNPYDYVYPKGLKITPKSGDPIYIEHTFVFADWQESALWYAAKQYQCVDKVYNIDVTVTMSFVAKRVSSGMVEDAAGDYVFDGKAFVAYNAAIHQDYKRYSNHDWYFAGMVEDAAGDYVFDGKEFVAYNAAKHTDYTRYRSLSGSKENEYLYIYSGSGEFVETETGSGVYVPYSQRTGNWDGKRYHKEQVVAVTNVYEQDVAGDYVFIKKNSGGAYVLYDADNAAHKKLQRYSCVGTTTVTYRVATDGVGRLVMDPNKVDYRCLASYPVLVVVTFTDNTKAVVAAEWRLDAIMSVDPKEGYVGKVDLYIPLSQPLAAGKDGVDMRIESTRPKAAYYQVALNEDGEPILDDANEYVDAHGEIELNLLDIVETYEPDAEGDYVSVNGDYVLFDSANVAHQNLQRYRQVNKLVVNDLSSEALIHSIICGCDQYPDCKGYLYFDYGDSSTQKACFAITEWQNLDAIRTALIAAKNANPDVPMSELSFMVVVTAVAHNLDIKINVHVNKSVMSEIALSLDGMPISENTMGSAGADIYSMTKTGDMALSVDPYVADIFDAKHYPSILQCTIRGKQCVTAIDGWDLSALKGKTPYLGASVTVYALVNTPFGDMRYAVALEVIRRVIESVDIDGQTNKIFINAMDSAPFGKEIVQEYVEEKKTIVEDGITKTVTIRTLHTYAIKSVVVKFEGDDADYYMDMRYDITGLKARVVEGELAKNASISVGNAAGGYQVKTGYSIYSKANNIMSVAVKADATDAYAYLKACFDQSWDGTIYWVDETGTANFVECSDDAWRYLTTNRVTLTLRCGNMMHEDDDTLQTVAYDAMQIADGAVGVGYCWQRATMAGKPVMRLKVWNTAAVANEFIDSTQYVSTGTNRYVALTRSMLNIQKLGESTELPLVYDHTYTVGDLLADYALKGTVLDVNQLSIAELAVKVYAASDVNFNAPLSADAQLALGEYVMRIAFIDNTNIYYSGTVDIHVTVSKCVINNLSVTIANQSVSLDKLLTGYNYPSNKVFTIFAECEQCTIMIRYYNYDSGEELGYRPSGTPGKYIVRFYCLVDGELNEGYQVDLGNGSNGFELTIQESDQ